MTGHARDEALSDEPRGSSDSDVIRPHESVSGRVVYSLILHVAQRNDELAMSEKQALAELKIFPQGTREAGDDFFCLRYRVWYPSFDCALRTRFVTSSGCLRSDQGRFNLKRHVGALRGIRWRLAPEE